MHNEFVEVFGFRPGSLNPCVTWGGLAGKGVEADLVAFKISKMEESCQEIEEEARAAREEGDEKKMVFWVGVLENIRTDTQKAKKLARNFEF